MIRTAAIKPTLPVLLAILLAILTPVMAHAQSNSGSTGNHGKLLQMATELRGITVRMGQVSQEITRLAHRESNQAALVSELKRRPEGVVRNAQLQVALKELRTALAARRGMIQRLRILATTQETRRVALSKLARAEAAGLMLRAEALMHKERPEAARERFADAFDYLTMAVTPLPKAAVPTHPSAFEPMHAALAPNGMESPDELRELAKILRDSGEKANWTAATLQNDLAQLQAERATLTMLLNRVPFSPPTGAEIYAALDDHIIQLSRQIDLLRQRFAAARRGATALERQAVNEEAALFAGEIHR